MCPPSTPRPRTKSDLDESPVTAWLRQLEAGDAQAAQPLYEHFCSRLGELARQRLPGRIRPAYDQDDAVVSAFHSLFLGIGEQRYQLHDRNDFWRLLLTITERKIAKRIRYETRDKRDVRRIVQDSVFMRPANDQPEERVAGVESLATRDPTPEFAAEVSETCEAMLASLPDETARQVALLKLENHTAEEIAEKLGCTRRTVQRKLLVIRRTWQHQGGIESDEMSQSRGKEALEALEG